MTEAESQFVLARTVANRFEADVVLNALKQEGIPAFLRPFEETPYTGLFVPQKGWGRIMVRKDMLARAREIICGLIEGEECKKGLFENAMEIDARLWTNLRQSEPEDITRKAVAEYSPEGGAYIVPFLNTAIMCYPDEEKIEIVGLHPDFSDDFQFILVTLHYLLGARENPLAGKLVSGKDLPSGNLFFRGPHALPAQSLLDTFDSDPKFLKAAVEAIGGEKINLGDLSYRFWIFPRIPVVLIFWMGDAEFESSFHFLFDESITLHFESLDLIWALANVFTRVLTRAATSSQG